MKREFAGLPVLDAGMHFDPSSGGCFMEYASLLAGERWSDHPSCTHPALAQLARLVNDEIPANARQRLVPLIPDVIGLTGANARVAPELALLCLEHAPALPRRGVVARAARRATRRSRAAAGRGAAARWCRWTDAPYRTASAGRVMAWSIRAISRDDTAGTQLYELLRDAIELTRRRLAARGARPDFAQLGSPTSPAGMTR